jgi:hypothetical protein
MKIVDKIRYVVSQAHAQLYAIFAFIHEASTMLRGRKKKPTEPPNPESKKSQIPKFQPRSEGQKPAMTPDERSVQIARAIKGLRRALHTAFWWNLVQDEVKQRLEVTVDNLAVLGPAFRDAFVAGFRYEYVRRNVEGQSLPSETPGALFGEVMSEEAFQCGIEPTKLVLYLSSWTEPNDADVQACMTVCHHIDEMQEKGLVAPSPSPSSLFEKRKINVAPVDPTQIFEMIFGPKRKPPRS